MPSPDRSRAARSAKGKKPAIARGASPAWVRYAIVAVLVVALLVAGIAAYAVETINPEQLRGPLITALTSATGRSVRIDGPLKIGFGDMSADKITIGNPPGMSRPDMMTAGEIAFSLKLWPLLHKSISVRSVEISDADIRLERDGGGKPNWNFSSGGAAAQTPQPGSSTANGVAPGGGFKLSGVGSITIKNARLSVFDPGKDRASLEASISEAVLRAPGGLPMSLKLAGTYNGQDIIVDLKGGPFEMLLNSGNRWSFEGAFAAFGYAGKLAGILTHEDQSASLHDIRLALGSSDLGGDLEIRRANGRTGLSGALSAKKVALSDFAPVATDGGDDSAKTRPGPERAAGRPRLFSDKPLPIDALRSIDADLSLSAGEADFGALALGQVLAKLKLADGELMLDVRASSDLSPQPIVLMLTAAMPPGQSPTVLVKAAAASVNLGNLMRDLGEDAMIEANGDMNVKLAGTGDSLHAIAGSSNGSARLVVGPGKIDSTALGLLTTDLEGLVGDNAPPKLTCMVGDAVFRNGTASAGLIADTTLFQITGSGPIDLGRETIDMRLTPIAKTSSIASLLVPVTIRGDLASPSIKPDMAALAGKAAGLVLGALDPTGLAEMALADVATGGESGPSSDSRACADAIKNPQAAARMKTGAPSADSNPIAAIIGKGRGLLNGFLGQ